MNVLVVGAAGGVGLHVVKAALDAGHKVTAFARRPEKVTAGSDRLKVVQGDALDHAALEAACKGKDAVLSALGSNERSSTVRSEGTRNLIDAMKKAGARRLAVLSAGGVGDSLEQAKKSSFIF